MDAIERAVRAALDKGDAGDRTFRNRIYASAQSALERSLSSRALPAGEVDSRRRHLAAAIASIEADFLPAAEADAAPYAEPDFAPEPRRAEPRWAEPPAASHRGREPAFERADPPAATYAPAAVEPDYDGLIEAGEPPRPPEPVAPSRAPELVAPRRVKPAPRELPTAILAGKPRKQPGRWRWLGLAFNTAFILLIAYGAWWTYGEAMRLYDEAKNPSAAPGKPQLSEKGVDTKADDKRWIEVFRPQDAALLTVPPGAQAKLGRTDGVETISLQSAKDGPGISVAVGQGILESLAGKRVLFNIRARSSSTEGAEMSVDCDFGALGACERKRFRVVQQAAEYMFAVTLGAQAPQGNGALVIGSDLVGEAPVEIESIRVSVIEPEQG